MKYERQVLLNRFSKVDASTAKDFAVEVFGNVDSDNKFQISLTQYEYQIRKSDSFNLFKYCVENI